RGRPRRGGVRQPRRAPLRACGARLRRHVLSRVRRRAGAAVIRPSHRLEQLPPYLFAELERKVSERRKAGVDVISLGIGDPDLPSPDLLVEEARRWVGDPSTHRYPSNRGLDAFRTAVAGFYRRRFGVVLDPDREVLPLLGGK